MILYLKETTILLFLLFLTITSQSQIQELDWSCFDASGPLKIEACPFNFIPTGGANANSGNTVQIKAKITGIDPLISGRFIFELFDVSDQPGYCMNAPKYPPLIGLHSDSWKDLQFSEQSGFTISGNNNQIAVSNETTDVEITITVKSFDYGAFGKMKVKYITSDNIAYTGITESFPQTSYISIPYDANNNYIADANNNNSGPGNSYLASDDLDNVPMGDGTNGDNISRYEEYRGFMVNGNFERTDVNRKSVFVWINSYMKSYSLFDNSMPTGYFNSANLGNLEIKLIDKEEFSYLELSSISDYVFSNVSELHQNIRKVNFNYEESFDGHIDFTYVLKLLLSVSTDSEVDFGITLGTGVGEQIALNNAVACFVKYNAINGREKLNMSTGILNSSSSLVKINIWEDTDFYYFPGWTGEWSFATSGTTHYLKPHGKIKIDDELIKYNNTNGLTEFLNCERGVDQTTAVEHLNTSDVMHFPDVQDFFLHNIGHELGHGVYIGHYKYNSQNINFSFEKHSIVSPCIINGVWQSGSFGGSPGYGYFNEFVPSSSSGESALDALRVKNLY